MHKSLRVLLVVYDNDSHISQFPMGIAYLASAARAAGYEITIYNQDVYHYPDEHLTDFLDKNPFDVVGIGACGGYYQYNKIKSLCRAVRASVNQTFLMLGGHLVSPDPAFFLCSFGCDVICVGEGEQTFVELLDARLNNKGLEHIKGIAYIDKNGEYTRTADRCLIEDIDTIPMPAYDLFPMDHYALLRLPNIKPGERCMPMLTGRGCTFTCNFCYRMDKGFRPRSTRGIIDEIKFLKTRYRIKYFGFMDELLMSSVERTRALCEGFISEDLQIKWSCNGRLNYARHDLLTLMKKAGCVFINYGIESVNDIALKNMKKALTVKQIITGIEATIAAGLSPGLNIIFGNIGENAECLKNDVNFLLKYDDHSQLRTIRPVTPYPGSPLFDHAVELGLIKDVEDFYENKHKNSDLLAVNFTDMTDEEFYKALYEANKILLENYLKHAEEKNMAILNDLYKNLNASFRGFRQT